MVYGTPEGRLQKNWGEEAEMSDICSDDIRQMQRDWIYYSAGLARR